MGREDETLIAPPAGSIGPYAVERILGQGGMGVVVAARGPDGARVAIKSMRAGVGARSMRERFAREAMVRIDHPNVIRSLGAGLAADGAPYIVFELLEGESLAQRLEAEPRLPVADVLSILDQACAGLEAAHAAGIVHRDLKPANVYLCADGTVKLLDFGIALVRGETRLTADASVLGTAAYLAPEQARGQRDLDERADVWALGVIAYEALSGRLPFDAASALATMLAIIQNDPPPLETLARHVPPELARVVERCLRKHRDERFPSATALRGALAGIDPASGARVRRESLPPAAARGLSTLRTDESRLVVVLLARDALDAAAIESEVRAQGGEAVALHGSHVVGLFGSERWRGDEARRAIGAAIAIRHLASRVAVASGRATAAGASGILGDGLSRAERACEHPLDGVAVVPDAAAAAGDVFLHGEATDDVVEVIGTRDDGADAHDDAHLPTLVGRQSELALLAEAVERGGIVCVSGPPGIGKTRLRHEILRMLEQRSVPPALVLSASGEPLERDRAFGLVAAALRRHARERASTRRWPPLRPEAPPLVQRQAVLALAREAIDDREAAQRCADGLALVIGIASDARRSHAQHDPQLVRDRMRLALLDYFAAWSTKGAAAIAFEDVQWADPETLALADELTVIHPEAFVLLTARSAAVFAPLQRAAERAVRIELGGLDVAGVQAIADGAAGRPLPDALLRALAERSEGNPLFVEHMASALRLKADLDAERLPLPFTVEAAIQARLDELAHDEREACKLASVVGRPFEADDLAALGAARPSAMLAALEAAGVIEARVGGQAAGVRVHGFKSALVADVAYRTIAPSIRQALHRRIAEHLEQKPGASAEEIALHYDRAGLPEVAARAYARAALEAAAHGDGERVLRCSQAALSQELEPSVRFALHAARADTLGFMGRPAEQAQELERALSAACAPAERARALSDQAWLRAREGALAEALEIGRRAVAEADAGEDASMRALARSRLAYAHMQAGAAAAAIEHVSEAWAAAEDTPPQVRALVAAMGAFVASSSGDLGATLDRCATAAGLFAEAGDVRRAAANEANLADCYNRIGEHEAAERALLDALAGCRRVGNRAVEGYVLLNLGYAIGARGHHSEALERLADAERRAVEGRDLRLAAYAKLYRALVLHAAGRIDGAAAEAAAARAAAEAAGQESLAASALALEARAASAAGDVERALRCSEEALARRDAIGGAEDDAEIFLARARALRDVGRAEEAGEVCARGAARVRELAARISSPEWRARFLELESHRALLGEPTERT